MRINVSVENSHEKFMSNVPWACTIDSYTFLGLVNFQFLFSIFLKTKYCNVLSVCDQVIK